MCFPMSLRWTVYIAPTPSKEGSKTQNSHFCLKLHFTWRKSATKFLCVNTVSNSHLPICLCKNGLQGISCTMWTFGWNWPTPFKHADFQSIFAHSAFAIHLSKKISVNTNRKSTMSFSVSLRRTVYVAFMPQRGLKNAKCSKFKQ